ncbi:MAG: AAA family ATPase, partial [Eubacterium sp.]|nr:AAA family ATPase [Eubacterium sp.]
MKYNKIIVVGCPGAGKSTFSRKLAEKTGIPLYHLDALYWKEDWTHISRERLRFIQKRIMKNDSWIIDGNFMNTMETRIKRCNLIIFLDYQTDVCLDGIVQRVG